MRVLYTFDLDLASVQPRVPRAITVRQWEAPPLTTRGPTPSGAGLDRLQSVTARDLPFRGVFNRGGKA